MKQEKKGVFFQFGIIINVLVSSFRFIWISMLWVYGHYTYLNSFSVGTVFRRQNLTVVETSDSIDVRFRRLKSLPVLRVLIQHACNVTCCGTSSTVWSNVTFSSHMPSVLVICYENSRPYNHDNITCWVTRYVVYERLTHFVPCR